MAAAAAVQELKDLTFKIQPAILFLMETRAPLERAENMRRNLKFEHMHCIEANGLSGGLCLFWKANMEINVIRSCQNYIHTTITDKDNNLMWQATFIYANPNYSIRRHFWNRLLSLNPNLNNPWLCLGDFNEVLEQHEKDGLREQSRNRMENFKEFLDEASLMDIHLKGCRFTWLNNPRQGRVTKEKN